MKYTGLVLCLIPGLLWGQTWTEEGGSAVTTSNIFLSAYTTTTSTMVTAGTWVSVDWSSTVYNSGFTISTASITVNATGKYLFMCSLMLYDTAGAGSASQNMVRAIINGTEVRQSYIQTAGRSAASGTTMQYVNRIVFIENISTSDTIVFQYTGTNLLALKVNNNYKTYSDYGSLPSCGQLTIIKVSQ